MYIYILIKYESSVNTYSVFHYSLTSRSMFVYIYVCYILCMYVCMYVFHLIERVDIGDFIHQSNAIALVGHRDQLRPECGGDELSRSTFGSDLLNNIIIYELMNPVCVIHTYMHTYIHTYIHTVYTYQNTSRELTYMHTYL